MIGGHWRSGRQATGQGIAMVSPTWAERNPWTCPSENSIQSMPLRRQKATGVGIWDVDSSMSEIYGLIYDFQ